jgi:hypothetical protein
MCVIAYIIKNFNIGLQPSPSLASVIGADVSKYFEKLIQAISTGVNKNCPDTQHGTKCFLSNGRHAVALQVIADRTKENSDIQALCAQPHHANKDTSCWGFATSAQSTTTK